MPIVSFLKVHFLSISSSCSPLLVAMMGRIWEAVSPYTELGEIFMILLSFPSFSLITICGPIVQNARQAQLLVLLSHVFTLHAQL